MELLKGYKFWEWFCNNQEKYLRLREMEAEEIGMVCAELDKQIGVYCRGLRVEFMMLEPWQNDLIVTAGGLGQYFDSAEELVLMAPKLKEWNIMALWPPQWDFPITFDYEGLPVSSDQLWFSPMESKAEPHRFGIEVYFKNYDAARETIYHGAAGHMVDVILGERAGALDIQYLQVEQLPKNYDVYAILPLETLPEYIEMWKEQVLMN